MPGALTLEEWSESSAEHKLLKENLRISIDVMCDRENEDVKKSLLRISLQMVRQFEKDTKGTTFRELR